MPISWPRDKLLRGLILMWMGWSLRHGFACLAVITIGVTISVLLYLTTDNLSRPHPSVFRKDFVTRWIRLPWRGGHAFIYSNFEEQTNGARNLWQLEMWAELLGIEVAERGVLHSRNVVEICLEMYRNLKLI